MAKTLNQLAAEVLDELGEDSTDADALSLAYGWIQRVFDEVGDDMDWRFNYILQEITTGALQRTYDLSVDVRDISSARIQTTGEIIEYRSKDHLFAGSYNMEDTGTPRYFYHDAFNPTTVTGKIGFFPIPNGLKVIELNCVGRPTRLSNAPLGSELVTDGEFAADLSAWTATNWTWAAGAAQHDLTFVDALSQNVTVAEGITYQISFTISGRTAGSVTFDVDGEFIFLTGATKEFTDSGSGNFKAAASGAVVFSITPSADFDGTVDNVSIRTIASIPVPNEFLSLLHEGALAYAHRHEREWESFDRTYAMFQSHLKRLKHAYAHPRGAFSILQQTDLPARNTFNPVRLPPGRFRN